MVENEKLKVIDFERQNYGDPWKDFNRILWSGWKSLDFCIGQLHGYFGEDPEEYFFELLAYYIANYILELRHWAIDEYCRNVITDAINEELEAELYSIIKEGSTIVIYNAIKEGTTTEFYNFIKKESKKELDDAVKKAQEVIIRINERTKDVLSWFNNMNKPIPKWYIKNSKY
jgi:hypothetical protein